MIEPRIVLSAGQTAIVGYGSLLSVASIARTFDGRYDGPFFTAFVDGWRRAWNVSMPNAAFYYEAAGERIYPERIRYLNVVPTPAMQLNCAVFVVDQHQLEAMHSREWIYDPLDVTAQVRGLPVTGGRAIMYVGKADHTESIVGSPRNSAVRRSYVRIVDQAVAAMSTQFQVGYWRTTDPVPANLVIDDVLDPQRPNPWAAAGSNYRPERQLDS